jgi:hypothetical protein
MDRIADSGSADMGSNPFGNTNGIINELLNWGFLFLLINFKKVIM